MSPRTAKRFFVCWWYSICTALTSVNERVGDRLAGAGPHVVRILGEGLGGGAWLRQSRGLLVLGPCRMHAPAPWVVACWPVREAAAMSTCGALYAHTALGVGYYHEYPV